MAAFRVLLLLLWLGVTASSKVDLQKRILGGQQCRQDERRYHALLVFEDSKGSDFCGGSLLRNGWILTAAHCWESGMTIHAYLGLHMGIVAPIRFPEGTVPKIYQDGPRNKKQLHDLMLLKLPDTATIPHGVTPIELPDCSDKPKKHGMMQIAGQGATFERSPIVRLPDYSPSLQCANVRQVACTTIDQDPKKYIYPHMFCGKTKGVDMCYGDSGGGLEYKGKLYGVNAILGLDPYTEPIFFVDICHPNYLSWIVRTIGRAPKP